MNQPPSLRRTFAFLGSALLVLVGGAVRAAEIGFIERFALAEDRGALLEELVPGTEDFYYFTCLHLQNERRLVAVDELLGVWIERHGRNERVIEIENRQALLRYETAPAAALDDLRQRLGLRFDHQRERPEDRASLPDRLDPALLSWEALAQAALDRHDRSLRGFEDRALEWLATRDLTDEQRRELLSRLARPDVPDLPRLVVEDLRFRRSRGFGSHPIHAQLLVEQLERCVALEPELLNQTKFVEIYLTKLWPDDDSDWRRDAEERELYLDRLWSFVSRLEPAHNSLKAHVLFHRLVHDRARGVWDRGRFLEYVRLPRATQHVSSEWLRRTPGQLRADLNAEFEPFTMLSAVRNDKELVHEYLEHFFTLEESYEDFSQYLDDRYLRRVFAETKILHGLGEQERWYSMISPAEVQELKGRVDIDFAPTNRTHFAADGQVALDVWIKNVPTLLVKVFEINTLSFYQSRGEEVTTAIDLDGLTANHERTLRYDDPPVRRVARHFEFPEIDRAGTFVIELIGNGKSSRALIRRGGLLPIIRAGAAGHVFSVVDHSRRLVPGARLWIGGHEYKPNDRGEITVPYTTSPGPQTVILVDGEIASLDRFHHAEESYALEAGFYVDRESLLAGREAEILVRPRLTLNGVPVSVAILADVRLTLTSIDLDGIRTTRSASDFLLSDDRESISMFQVPARLRTLECTLEGRVENFSRGKSESLSASESLSLNAIDTTPLFEAVLLTRAGADHVIDVRGKNGEPRPRRVVRVELEHRDFRDRVNVQLETNSEGRINLGPLEDISSIAAHGDGFQSRTWMLRRNGFVAPVAIQGLAGIALRVPHLASAGSGERPRRTEYALLEKRGARYVADRFDALAIEDGFVRIDGLEPGDYELVLKDTGRTVPIRLAEGVVAARHALSPSRFLEVSGANPLQIGEARLDGETLVVELKNHTGETRVHVVATRFEPWRSVLDELSGAGAPAPAVVAAAAPESLYVTGRDIGDEYRYVLERRRAPRYPGNMLERPSLLLNPWAIRDTRTELQVALDGTEFADKRPQASRREQEPAAETLSRQETRDSVPNLDFLDHATFLATNLEPDEDGVLRVTIDHRQSRGVIRIVALDGENAVFRDVSGSPPITGRRDLRLAESLDPSKHLTEQEVVNVVPAEAELVIPDLTSSTFEVYDTIESVYGLFRTISGDAKLQRFSFVVDWPTLEGARKRELYSEFACHELNFFLYEKDPEFFREVVRPFVACKKEKTFIDQWLLGEPLEEFTRPWAFARLNIVEKILLGRRLLGSSRAIARHVRDLRELLPPDREREDRLFATALGGRSLDTGDRFGVEAIKRLEEDRRVVDQLRKLPAVAARTEALAEQEIESLGVDAESPDAVAPADDKAGRARDAASARSSSRFRAGGLQADARDRGLSRRFYRELEETKEWVENHYFELPIAEQDPDLITTNAFWEAFALHDAATPFISGRVAQASRSFPEMMFALAVLDLPFKAAEHESSITGREFRLEAGSSLLVFHKEVREATPLEEDLSVLVSEDFFRNDARYVEIDGEKRDRYVDRFNIDTVYGGHVVVTNPTSTTQRLDVLVEIPQGAVPVYGSHRLRSIHVDLDPYRTWTHDYYFYFPQSGRFRHYPAHVSKNDAFIAAAERREFDVSAEEQGLDRSSWAYVSQSAEPSGVLAFLERENLYQVDLARIAWRLRDKGFFADVIERLASRLMFDSTVWSYGFLHRDEGVMREYLLHRDDFVSACGAALASPLLTIDPVERRTYEHMEYAPLVNARAHRLGERRQILNDRLHLQYTKLLDIAAHRSALSETDRIQITYYLFLQDRVEEALVHFRKIRAEELSTTLQYDYLAAYAGLYTEQLNASRAVASPYLDYPVPRWRNRFAQVVSQIDEIRGGTTNLTETSDTARENTQLAATESYFDFEVENRVIHLKHRGLASCRVNYYAMDVELLFSRSPFVDVESGQFTFVKPNSSMDVTLEDGEGARRLEIPERFHSGNVLVEVVAGGTRKTVPYFANDLEVELVENYAQLRVRGKEEGGPLGRTYVKVYARLADGSVRFYKDGYTDLRGRFDYGALSTDELGRVERFALLVLSDEHGATVEEVAPPKT